MTVTLSGSYPLPNPTGGPGGVPGIASAAYIADVIENIVLSDLGRDQMLSAQRPITVASSAPSSAQTGEHWLDTSGATKILRRYDGANWVAIVEVAATAPAWTEPGLLWYDTTNSIYRFYGTRNSHTGWHGTDPGVLLMTNRSGSSVSKGMVAMRDTTGTTVHEATTTTTVKDRGAVGIWLEDTDNAADGLVALLGSGMTVQVLCDDWEADGAVVKGDGLVTFSVAGEARTVGPIGAGPFIAADHGREMGVPMGCFAEALTVKDGSHLAWARLLPSVGEGCTVYHASNLIDGTLTFDDTWQELTVSQGTLTAKRKPMVGALVRFAITIDPTTSESVETSYQVSTNQNGFHVHQIIGEGANQSNDILSGDMDMTFIPTSSGTSDSYAKLGEIFYYKGTLGTSDALDTGAAYSLGYVY